MKLFHNGALGIRTLEPEDAALLAKWLSDPAVLQYYEGRDRPRDMELVRKHFYEEIDDNTPCIIEFNSTPIGYLQFYEIDDDEKEEYGYAGKSGKIYGMDQFIGEIAYWNRGIGSQLIKDTVDYLIGHKEAAIIVMDPQAWNARALRVYEKNGFVKKKYLERHEWHEGEYRDCWLIEYDASVIIRTETEQDLEQIRQVNIEAFGNRNDEADLVDRIRSSDGYIPELSIVAERNGEIIGHILLSKAEIVREEESREVIVLAPIAVKPDDQKRGIGKRLITEGLLRCKGLGYSLVLLIGHPSYYPKFGFKPARPFGLELKQFQVSDDVFMVCELKEHELGRVKGELRYPKAFFG